MNSRLPHYGIGGTKGGGTGGTPLELESGCVGAPGKALGGAGGVTGMPGPNGFDGSGISRVASAGVLPGVGSLKPVLGTAGAVVD